MSRSLPWFVIGQFCFGLLIGVMVGLSFSPTVGSLITLLFAFIGGSILVLTRDRSEDELAIIGMSVTFLSIAIIIGALTGIYLRVGPPASLQAVESSIRDIDQNLSIDEIGSYGVQPEYIDILCTMIQNSTDMSTKVSKLEIVKLMEKGVDRRIIMAMLDSDSECTDKATKTKGITSKTGNQAVKSGFGLYGDQVRKELFGMDDPMPLQIQTE